jgi:peptidoglycan/LPS O-acetylase OafA/YrhL
MTMLHGFFPIGHVDGVYWTLFVEMKFYFFIFILISTKQIHHTQHYLGLWLIVSLLSLQYPSSIIEYAIISKQSAYFISGAVFYLIWREGISLYKIVLLLGSYILAICNAMQLLTTKINWYHIFFSTNVMILIITVFYVFFFLIVFNKTARIRCDFFIFLGALTYPLYLLHSRIGFVAFNAGYSHVNRYVLLAGILTAICYLAYLVHAKIEARFSPVFKRYLEGRLKFIPE